MNRSEPKNRYPDGLALHWMVHSTLRAKEALMQAQSGRDHVDGTTFNCDGKYDAQAASLFQNVRITSITIGWNPSGPWSSCPSGQ